MTGVGRVGVGVGVGVHATTVVGATGAFRGATRRRFNLVLMWVWV